MFTLITWEAVSIILKTLYVCTLFSEIIIASFQLERKEEGVKTCNSYFYSWYTMSRMLSHSVIVYLKAVSYCLFENTSYFLWQSMHASSQFPEKKNGLDSFFHSWCSMSGMLAHAAVIMVPPPRLLFKCTLVMEPCVFRLYLDAFYMLFWQYLSLVHPFTILWSGFFLLVVKLYS